MFGLLWPLVCPFSGFFYLKGLLLQSKRAKMLNNDNKANVSTMHYDETTKITKYYLCIVIMNVYLNVYSTQLYLNI